MIGGNYMHTNEELADLIFPDIHETVEDLEKRYPPRNLPEGALVTRFAPSPTGFLHTGSLFTALIAYYVAHMTHGVYFFRLEDTDQKREIKGSGNELVDQLAWFGLKQDEGFMGEGRDEQGNYGPYVQSHRGHIYDIVIKDLIKRGRAYPCFCTKEDLDQLRLVQEANKVVPGYYGEYATCRNKTIDEAFKLIKEGKPYVIRFKSMGDHNKFFKCHDLVRGTLSLPENDQDIIIRKGNNLPTYHFAHLCDDHFMRTNCVTRGEEWLSSLPIHLELFKTMGWEAPQYAHLPVILVQDKETGNKRKLSKRKDKEAAVSFFIQEGYPKEGILEYLLTISNSNFEEWMHANPREDVFKFPFSFTKMSREGALFDLPKLCDISQNVLAYMDAHKISSEAYEWAKTYSPELTSFIEKNKDKFEAIMNIERDQPKPRKDYVKYSDILPKITFFDKDIYESKFNAAPLPFDSKFDHQLIKDVLTAYKNSLDLSGDTQTWFGKVKELAVSFGFAANGKEYKANPFAYKGVVGDVAAFVRICITTTTLSPSLFDVQKILGRDEVIRRIDKAIATL